MSNQRSILAPHVWRRSRHGYARAPALFRGYASGSQPNTDEIRWAYRMQVLTAAGLGWKKRRALAWWLPAGHAGNHHIDDW